MVKLNAQGMSRRNKPLMSALTADSADTLVSVDFSAGEPTVTAHFSRDPRYLYANFTGVGKEPHYSNGVLMIDDMYLMGASVAPTGQDAMKEAFNSTYGGMSFAEQWVLDKDVIKSDASIKPVRASHKTSILAMQYGQGPAGMVANAADNGVSIKLSDAKRFHKAFWNDLFPGVRDLGKRLTAYNKQNGCIVNPFGFRLFPADYKCLNYFIQSCVSGLMDMLMANFYTLAPYCDHIVVIHDEMVFSCPTERLAEAKLALKQALKHLNDTLGWSVNIRTGWVVGKDMYEAH